MTDDDFSFASLVKPGEATRQVVERELQRRKEEDDRRWRWEPGYVYTGTADYLLKHGQWFTGRTLPERWEAVRGPYQRCFQNALEACERAPDLRYYQGVYLAGTTVSAHGWVMDEDGVVEVTFSTVPMESGHRIALSDRRGGKVPWMNPERWVYCGVEFDPAWARQWIMAHGMHPSILDPRAQDEVNDLAQDDDIFRHLYRREGAPIRDT